MSTTAPDLSVVICAYTEERWGDLVAAIDSVRRQSTPPREIIVAVDHNPRLLGQVRAHLPEVVVVANRPETPGLSGARNSGLAAALGAVVAFLDDDALAEPDWLACLAAGYSNPRVLGVGGAIAPLWACGRPRWFPEEFHWVVGCTYRGLPPVAAPVRNLIGANMSFRRAALEAIGGFRSGFGQVGAGMLRCDDTELCLRLQRRWPGGLLLYDPRARVAHRVPASRARWPYFRTRCYTEGLAKALLVRLAGPRRGLAAERAYTTRTLPRGVLRGLKDAALRGDPGGLLRAGGIVAGLSFTTAGYLRGRAAERRERVRGAGVAAGAA